VNVDAPPFLAPSASVRTTLPAGSVTTATSESALAARFSAVLDLLADQPRHLDLGGRRLRDGHGVELDPQCLELLELGERGELGHEGLVVHRLGGVLVGELRQEELQELVLAEVLRGRRGHRAGRAARCRRGLGCVRLHGFS
jgi:hypothetical protein